MAIVTKRNVIAAVTATGIIATGVIATLVGGGQPGGAHFDTSLDASSNLVPPTDWRIGYARTGTIYYTQSATTTKSFAANVLPYTTDATDTGWPIEPAM
ncbi:MAG: hypothetical protein ACYSWO_30140, partial [Planctomycetota bacterium]